MIILLILSLLVCFKIQGAELDSKFVRALNMVEASGRTNNVPAGDRGLAIGPFQIHLSYFKDARKYDKSLKLNSYRDCERYDISVKVVNAYLNRYGSRYIISSNYEALARLHNSGPKWSKKLKASDDYWKKVKKVLTH